jgi:uncharacterized protein YaiI (UPF0178 family)
MKIWVDADACPKVIREIVIRAAERTGLPTAFVTNQALRLNVAPHITLMQVPDGPDVADGRIVELCAPGDLVITADIPFAAKVVEKGASALDPAGRLYTSENIKQILNMRDFMDSMRGSAALLEQGGGGGPGFGPKQRQEFSNQLDKIVAKAKKP